MESPANARSVQATSHRRWANGAARRHAAGAMEAQAARPRHRSRNARGSATLEITRRQCAPRAGSVNEFITVGRPAAAVHNAGVSRRFWFLPALLGLVVGCATNTDNSSGCGESPTATDVGPPAVVVVNQSPPCSYGVEGVRGSNPSLRVTFPCNGKAEPFLVGVKVDGRFYALREATCADYSTSSQVDFGPWSTQDSDWHSVDVTLDPLDIFRETDEDNNHATAQIRMVQPDLGVYESLCGFTLTEASGNQWGTWVDQVFPGTPVDVRMLADIRGRYATITMSVHNGATLDSTATVAGLDCAHLGGSPQLIKRWLPPGPGTYDVEFRVQHSLGSIDANPANDLFVKQLRVTN